MRLIHNRYSPLCLFMFLVRKLPTSQKPEARRLIRTRTVPPALPMPPRPGSASVRSANQVCSSLHLSNLVVSSTTYSTQAIRQVRIKQQKQTVRPDATNIMCSSLKKPSIRRVLLSSTGRIFTSGCSGSALDTLKHLELLLTPDNTPRCLTRELFSSTGWNQHHISFSCRL